LSDRAYFSESSSLFALETVYLKRCCVDYNWVQYIPAELLAKSLLQEFLKRIPSTSAFSGPLDDKFFGSSHSLFNFGGASASGGDATMHRVTSLDMLRLCDSAARSHTDAKGAEQPGLSPVGRSQQQKLFQPSHKGNEDATERSAAMPVSDPHIARHVQPNGQGLPFCSLGLA
jgi:hypothetical protein